MKIKASLVLISLMVGVLSLAGCTSLKTAAKAQGEGETVVYRAPFNEVWAVMPTVITNVGLHLVSANRDKHLFLANHGITGWSWGENVAVFVNDVGEGKTSVEVVTKWKLVTNVTAPNWDGPIFVRLDEKFKRD